MAMKATDIKKNYDIPIERLDEIEGRASLGVLPGEPGPVSAGRPLKFGQALKLIGCKEILKDGRGADRRAR